MKMVLARPITGFRPVKSDKAPAPKPPSRAPNVIAEVIISYFERKRCQNPASLGMLQRKLTFCQSLNGVPRSLRITTSVPEITPVS